MESIDYWLLCDEFSVIQATLLIIGEDPSEIQEWVENYEPHNRPQGFDAVFAALKHAINSNRLKAKIRRQGSPVLFEIDPLEYESKGYDTFVPDPEDKNLSYAIKSVIDWQLTTVYLDDLRAWLQSRGIKTGFFFPQSTGKPDYLDPKHPKYSPKLAAAIRAWEAVTTDPRYNNNGKTPKANIENWLNSHAAEYDLVKENGENNADAIKNQIAKVANWQPDGGAPKTPSK